MRSATVMSHPHTETAAEEARALGVSRDEVGKTLVQSIRIAIPDLIGPAGARIAVFAVATWYSSPQLRWTAQTFVRDYQLYKERNAPTSIGLRLEFWSKSLGFFAEAPLIGHGSGATRGLFERVATSARNQASSEVIGNPHNQTLNVAVQWGIAGVAVLFTMWILHLLLFRGEGLVNWIGLLVVIQNMLTSLLNSHLFDFNEGWIYVLGVGIAGGMTLSQRASLQALVEAGSASASRSQP